MNKELRSQIQDGTVLKVPESIYQHLLQSMASCYSFRIYLKGPDPPLLRKLAGEQSYYDISKALKSLYDAVHLPDPKLLQACGQTNRQGGRHVLSLNEREELLTEHPITSIVPDLEDWRDYWDVIDDTIGTGNKNANIERELVV